MSEPNYFDVMKEMSARNLEIYFGPDILRAQKVKAGTQITVGIGGDLIAAIVDGRIVGGLFLWNRKQFDETKGEILRGARSGATAPATAGDGPEASRLPGDASAPCGGGEIGAPVRDPESGRT